MRRRSMLSYEVPPSPPGQMLGEAMFRIATSLAGEPRLSVAEWERRCRASSLASLDRRMRDASRLRPRDVAARVFAVVAPVAALAVVVWLAVR